MAFTVMKLLKPFCRRRFPAQGAANELTAEPYGTADEDDENPFSDQAALLYSEKDELDPTSNNSSAIFEAPPAPWTQIEAARSTTKLLAASHKKPNFARVHNCLGKNGCKQKIEMWERYDDVSSSKTGEVGRIVVFIQKDQNSKVIAKDEVQTHEFEECWSGVKAPRATSDVVRYDLRIQTLKCVACGQRMDCNLCFIWDEKKHIFEPLLQTYASK